MSDITTEDTSYSGRPHNSRNKILMLGPLPPTVGGITTFIKGISESDLNRKYKFILFGTERPTAGLVRDVDDYTLMFRIGLIPLAKSTISTILHMLRFPFVLIMNHPDIVHVHTASYWSFWENAVYSLISKFLCRKAIIHIHGGSFHKFYKNSNALVKFLIRKVLNMPDKIIVLSSKWKSLLMDIACAHPEDRVVVLENFVDLSKFAHFAKELDVSEDVINVLFVGGVGAKTKGIYDVLKVIPIVAKERKNILFSFVACGNIEKSGIIGKMRTHECINETFISHTNFLDYVSDDRKIKLFAAADIFVLPSHSEGLPITMLEAMAGGLPVIATSVGSIPEVIEEGKNGFLIEVGDYRALAEKILLLAKDKELRQKMAVNNINKIRKRYNRTVVVRKLGNLYGQLLDN